MGVDVIRIQLGVELAWVGRERGDWTRLQPVDAALTIDRPFALDRQLEVLFYAQRVGCESDQLFVL